MMIAAFTLLKAVVETSNVTKDTENIVNTGWKDFALEEKVVPTCIEHLKPRASWTMMQKRSSMWLKKRGKIEIELDKQKVRNSKLFDVLRIETKKNHELTREVKLLKRRLGELVSDRFRMWKWLWIYSMKVKWN